MKKIKPKIFSDLLGMIYQKGSITNIYIAMAYSNFGFSTTIFLLGKNKLRKNK